MTEPPWIEAIGARVLGPRPFAPRSRKTPRLGPASEMTHLELPLERWDGPIGDWAEHFGKGRGQVKSLDGAAPLRSCTEVETAKRLRLVRDHAFWFNNYASDKFPDLWRAWTKQPHDEPAEWLGDLDAAIRRRVASKRGGLPDVVAWNDERPLATAIFMECKGPRERIGANQEDWLWAALQEGVRLDQVAECVRPF